MLKNNLRFLFRIIHQRERVIVYERQGFPSGFVNVLHEESN